MIGLEQGLWYSLMIGVLLGIVWGGRKIILLERLIYGIDQKIERVLQRVEKEELKIEKSLKKK